MKGGQKAKKPDSDPCDCPVRYPWNVTYYYLQNGVVHDWTVTDIREMPTTRRNVRDEIKIGKNWFELLTNRS